MGVTYFAVLYWLEASHTSYPTHTQGEEITERREHQRRGSGEVTLESVCQKRHWKADIQGRPGIDFI